MNLADPDHLDHLARDEHPVRIIGVAAVPSANRAEIQQRTGALAAEDERTREGELVDRIISHAGAQVRGAVGAGPTLGALMAGLAMVVAAVPDLDGEVWRCTWCRFVCGQQISTCPVCGVALETIALREILPLLVRRNRARLELVGGEAADRLRRHGGIGAVLRYVPGS